MQGTWLPQCLAYGKNSVLLNFLIEVSLMYNTVLCKLQVYSIVIHNF